MLRVLLLVAGSYDERTCFWSTAWRWPSFLIQDGLHDTSELVPLNVLRVRVTSAPVPWLWLCTLGVLGVGMRPRQKLGPLAPLPVPEELAEVGEAPGTSLLGPEDRDICLKWPHSRKEPFTGLMPQWGAGRLVGGLSGPVLAGRGVSPAP